MDNPLKKIADAQTLAQAIVDTIHEPLLVLDAQLRVLAASRSFYDTFQVDVEHTQGCLLYALGDGQWDIPALRVLLETIIPERAAMDEFEVEHDFPGLGHRTMLLNARKVIYETSQDTTILLAFTDITARRAIEREKAELLEHTEQLVRQKQVLLQEMEHRVNNSLQIIASILLMKARGVISEETRLHLRDAHQRVMSVAAVQSHLHSADGIEAIAVGAYLTKLCASLSSSMIGEAEHVRLEVVADEGRLGSAQAVSIGLIVTELVINALKYAFPMQWPDALVRVTFTSRDADWTLVVSDNGVGKAETGEPPIVGGLGTAIIKALVKQLGAEMTVLPTPAGLCLSITHTSPPAILPAAA